MLLLLLSLFSNDIILASEETKAKFNDSSLMNQYRKNFLQVQTFIKDAKKQFNDDIPELREGLNDNEEKSTNEHMLLNNNKEGTSINEKEPFILQTPIVPIRSRPIFPFEITPHTTEQNGRHLRWDEIFNSAGPTKYNISPVIPKIASQPSEMVSFSDPTSRTLIHVCTKPLNPSTISSSNMFLSDTRSDVALISPASTTNDEVMKIWFQEITTYTPVEKWVETFNTKTGITPSYNKTKQTEKESSNQNRRFHSTSRERKHHHSNNRNRGGQRYYPKIGNEEKDYQLRKYQMIRSMKTIEDRKSNLNFSKRQFRRTKQKKDIPNIMKSTEKYFKQMDPADSPKILELHNNVSKDKNRSKTIKRRNSSRHKKISRRAFENKKSFYDVMKEHLKALEIRKKAKQLKIKANLRRNLVEGSAYSDEEGSLRMNLVKALKS